MKNEIGNNIGATHMTPYNEQPYRHSIRLPDYDYAGQGYYYVTVCVQDRERLFGEVVGHAVQLNDVGRMIEHLWHELPKRFPDVRLSAFVIMPNHIHGIIEIIFTDEKCIHPKKQIVGARLPRPSIVNGNISGGKTPPLRGKRPTLGQIIAYFKYQTTKNINQHRNMPGVPVWQRNYYEHIIREKRDYEAICLYIRENPVKWENDEYYF